jgi:hypothetical protein
MIVVTEVQRPLLVVQKAGGELPQFLLVSRRETRLPESWRRKPKTDGPPFSGFCGWLAINVPRMNCDSGGCGYAKFDKDSSKAFRAPPLRSRRRNTEID